MAQSQRTSPYADLLIIVGRMPWWINLLFAVLSWLLLHQYASSSVSSFSNNKADGVLTAPLFRQLAALAQYLVPLAFVCAAALAGLSRLTQRRLQRTELAETPQQRLINMEWPAFRQLLEAAWRDKGYCLLGNSLPESDGSCDLLLERGAERYLVLCRYWRASHLSVAPLREFFTRIVTEGAEGGFVIICGEFSDEARAFAAERQMVLIDGARLQRWLVAHGLSA